MTLALYCLVGAVFATGGWFYALGRVDDYAWDTHGFVWGWVMLCVGWPVFVSYLLIDRWVSR